VKYYRTNACSRTLKSLSISMQAGSDASGRCMESIIRPDTRYQDVPVFLIPPPISTVFVSAARIRSAEFDSSTQPFGRFITYSIRLKVCFVTNFAPAENLADEIHWCANPSAVTLRYWHVPAPLQTTVGNVTSKI
jgi:hypothetical protein